MLSSVFLSGRLGEKKDAATRIVEVDHLIPGPGGRYLISSIPVRSMVPESMLLKAKKGSLIILKGRLQSDERDGSLYIVDEIDEIYSLPSGMKRG